jgi:hypothetical protein
MDVTPPPANPPRTYQGRGFRRATMPTPIPIYSLPFFTITQMRAMSGLLRAYIDGAAPDTNEGQDYNPPDDLAEVAAACAHLDSAIEAHDKQACGGTLAYETMGGAFRVHKDGVYRFKCQRCGDWGTNDGASLTCNKSRLTA